MSSTRKTTKAPPFVDVTKVHSPVPQVKLPVEPLPPQVPMRSLCGVPRYGMIAHTLEPTAIARGFTGPSADTSSRPEGERHCHAPPGSRMWVG